MTMVNGITYKCKTDLTKKNNNIINNKIKNRKRDKTETESKESISTRQQMANKY